MWYAVASRSGTVQLVGASGCAPRSATWRITEDYSFFNNNVHLKLRCGGVLGVGGRLEAYLDGVEVGLHGPRFAHWDRKSACRKSTAAKVSLKSCTVLILSIKDHFDSSGFASGGNTVYAAAEV